MVQQEIEAVIVGDDVEEEEAVVLQDEGCPAVIVEEVPSAQVEECYSAQVLVYDDDTYLMQDVAEEQEVVTEVVETGKSQSFEFCILRLSLCSPGEPPYFLLFTVYKKKTIQAQNAASD